MYFDRISKIKHSNGNKTIICNQSKSTKMAFNMKYKKETIDVDLNK